MQQWKIKSFIICHVWAVLLIFSWLWPATRHLWDTIDDLTFTCLNQTLDWHVVWSFFWTILNQRLIDLIIFAIFFSLFCLTFRQKTTKEGKLAQLTDTVSFGIYVLLTTVSIRIIQHYLPITDRQSPSLIYDWAIRLSHQFPWIYCKDASGTSFPADHCYVIITLTVFLMTTTKQKRLRIIMLAVGTFLCIPRLIAGAHWLTDATIGSFPMALIILSWFYFTPLRGWMNNKLGPLVKNIKVPGILKWTRRR